ncbi:MAG: restriction endonuclease subunit S [Acidobacteriota bacterium]
MKSKFQNIEIGKLVCKIITCDPKVFKQTPTFHYVDISSINRVTKQIETTNQILLNEAPSRARQIINYGDILVSTVRPNLNAVAQVPINLNDEIASTGFTVLRPDASKLDSRFLFHWVKNSQFVSYLEKNAAGASYPAVTDKIVKAGKIPLPPLPEQKRIAEVLDSADALREKRRLALRKLDSLLQSVFLEMFGDPVRNPKGWEVKRFDELGKLERGKSKHRPRNAPELLGGKYPLIQTGEVANAKGYIKSFTQTYSEIGLKQSRMWKAGTLCITIAANIAKTAILTFDACFPDSIVGFIANESVKTEYVQHWLSFRQKEIEEKAPESAQKNINLKILSELDVPLPPIELQNKFAEIVKKIEALKAEKQKSAEKIENLFQSLQQRAFKGELFTL